MDLLTRRERRTEEIDYAASPGAAFDDGVSRRRGRRRRTRPKFFKGMRDRQDVGEGRVRPLYKSSRLRGPPVPPPEESKDVQGGTANEGFGTETIVVASICSIAFIFVVHFLVGWAEALGFLCFVFTFVLVSFEGSQKDVDVLGFFKMPPSGIYFISILVGCTVWWFLPQFFGAWIALLLHLCSAFSAFYLLKHLRSEKVRESLRNTSLVR